MFRDDGESAIVLPLHLADAKDELIAPHGRSYRTWPQDNFPRREVFAWLRSALKDPSTGGAEEGQRRGFSPRAGEKPRAAADSADYSIGRSSDTLKFSCPH